MDKQVTIYCKNTKSYHSYPLGTRLGKIYEDLNIQLKHQVVAAKVNHKVEDLNFSIFKPKDIEFIDTSSASGLRVYVRTLCMVLGKAVSELYPEATLRIEHPIAKGYYCKIESTTTTLTNVVIDSLKSRVRSIIQQGKRINCEEQQIETVKEIFEKKMNQKDKISLFDTIGNPYYKYFRIDEYYDYYHGVLLPSTDYLNIFDLVPYYDGMLLCVPNRDNPNELEKVQYLPKMYDIFKEYIAWNRIMAVNNVGEFNSLCKNRQVFNLIKIAEALHEKKISMIADMIEKKSDKIRCVLISGPSSSGKTTLSKRLSVQLMVCGLKPIALSLDNYFLSREDTPLDEFGEYDFEHLHALDLKLLNRHLKQLFNGEEVEIPEFNFEDGRRYYKGNKVKMNAENILIIEGIHGLNPELTSDIPEQFKFKIYVSALTTISIDNHNWIPTSDTRLLRRIIRDYRFRNYSAQQTIARWPSVRRGEEKWIFPHQENADVMFNSALIFELAVLKQHAESILAEVPKSSDEYTETHRLLKFLNYFVSIPESDIPPTSLLREFLGGSSFKY